MECFCKYYYDHRYVDGKKYYSNNHFIHLYNPLLRHHPALLEDGVPSPPRGGEGVLDWKKKIGEEASPLKDFV